MPSRKTRKRPFQFYEGIHEEDRHIRKTHFLLNHPNYIALSSNAKVLYDYMLDWAMGKKEVTFSASLASGLMARATFMKSRDELINLGFIKYINAHCARDLKKTGQFEFSSDWIHKSNPEKSVREYVSTYKRRA